MRARGRHVEGLDYWVPAMWAGPSKSHPKRVEASSAVGVRLPRIDPTGDVGLI
jgi:hypothetical protein